MPGHINFLLRLHTIQRLRASLTLHLHLRTESLQIALENYRISKPSFLSAPRQTFKLFIQQKTCFFLSKP